MMPRERAKTSPQEIAQKCCCRDGDSRFCQLHSESRRELGDGEPSPPPDELSFDQHADLLYSRNKWHMLCNGLSLDPAKSAVADVLKAVGGAAQEVSPRQKAMQAAHEIEDTCIEQDDSGHRFEVSRAAAIIEKLLAGDTRELKAALKEMVWLNKSLQSKLVKAEDYNLIMERAEKLLG